MTFSERELPGDGTLAAVFVCETCGHETAMLTNPMETRLVSSLGIEVGGRSVPLQPMETVRSQLETGRDEAFDDTEVLSPGAVRWSDAAGQRLGSVPSFVRGMVKRIYAEYAAERGIEEITPEVMDRARRDLGLEGM
jgi:hypothetical protein